MQLEESAYTWNRNLCHIYKNKIDRKRKINPNWAYYEQSTENNKSVEIELNKIIDLDWTITKFASWCSYMAES